MLLSPQLLSTALRKDEFKSRSLSHIRTMASSPFSKIVPLEMVVLVGHKIRGTTSERGPDQLGSIQLPFSPTKPRTRAYRRVEFLNEPSPNHGFLHVSNGPLSFDQLLVLFTTAYRKTLDTEEYIFSKKVVPKIFFNYTEDNGARGASTWLIGNGKGRFDRVFKSARAAPGLTPCRCGCGQEHHGPAIVMVLDGDAWDMRADTNFDQARNSYTLHYKDDLKAKSDAFPFSTLMPLIVKQEMIIMKSTARNAAIDEAEGKTLRDAHGSQGVDLENVEEVKTLRRKNEEFAGRIAELQARIDGLVIENQELKRQQQEQQHLPVTNARLVSQNNELTDTLRAYSRQWALAEDPEQNEEDDCERCSKMEQETKALKADNLDLTKRLTDATTAFAILPHNHIRQVSLQPPRTEGTLNVYSDLLPFNQSLLSSLEGLAHRDIRSTKESAAIRAKLDELQKHLQDKRLYLVMDDATELLRVINTFPLPVTDIECSSHVTKILNHAKCMALKDAPILATVSNNSFRPATSPVAQPNQVLATDTTSSDAIAAIEPPAKRRKLNDTPLNRQATIDPDSVPKFNLRTVVPP